MKCVGSIVLAFVVLLLIALGLEHSRRVYWKSVERVITERASETLAAQRLAIEELKDATNSMAQVHAARKDFLLLLDAIKIPSGPILETNRDVKFYDDRTNLVLTVIYTNGTWVAIKP